MKNKILILVACIFSIALLTNKLIAQDINIEDSLALVELYNSTDGPNWQDNHNWLTDKPVEKWANLNTFKGRVVGIYLSYNLLKGTMPASLGNLDSLVTLDLSHNKLTGNIPASFGNLINLQDLKLNYNQLSGSIPSSLGNVRKITQMYLSDNLLIDTIPASLGEINNLSSLYLENNLLSGRIPAELAKLRKLVNLSLYNNNLSGSIPKEIGTLRNLDYLNVSHNNLSGELIFENGDFKKLESLHLSNNHFSGNIIKSLEKLESIAYLSIDSNELKWKIGPEIGNLVTLRTLSLKGNKISGRIPPEIGNLTILSTLDLSYNELSDSLPSTIGNLTALYILRLNNNKLSGAIPASFFNYKTGYINIYIQNNHFTFEGLEPLIRKYYIIYSPQGKIPVNSNSNSLSVSAGGTLENNIYSWYKMNENDSGAIKVATIKQDSVFHPEADGEYFVKVDNRIAASLTLKSFRIKYTSPSSKIKYNMSEKNSIMGIEAKSIYIYPNPAKDFVFVNINDRTTFSIISQAGKVLSTSTVNNSGKIDLSNILAGSYYLKNNNSGRVDKLIVLK